ncbi:TetR/AcrR family transcriptional regulator [Brachybacterium fresconis]|uniref:AcrR family transcriptional regulator n=1 Tax=Brachybacterium fresconis TaxID=173363 RepID=A0ABS4YQ59_9MICO|nr:TetR/AcrR family transcriptional regulator [Brachybacterium fresconis]MBP2410931.1 AcrR family transcriptional regulator [Brachybacterium fresconis]
MNTSQTTTEQKPSTPRTSRALARERTLDRIVELGNAQLAECGAAELSVREIARGLGMVSSAIYRYVSCREELLTLLIVDAYGDLADTVDEAVEQAGRDPRTRFLALARAMVAWAIAHPERWTLLYGTPVSDYDAPAEATNADGTRVMAAVLAIAADAAGVAGAAGAAGSVGSDGSAESVGADGSDGSDGAAESAGGRPAVQVTPEVQSLLETHLAEFAVQADAVVALRAVTAWSSLVGVVSAHVFGQLGADAVAVGEQMLDSQVEMLAELVIGS